MDMEQAKAWAFIVGAIGAIVIPIATLIVTSKVHRLVNSAMTAEKVENSILRSMLVARDITIASAEQARAVLAATPAPPTVLAVLPLPPTNPIIMPSGDRVYGKEG